jgi:ABC-type sugar transport system substrate-binding protein
MGQDHEWTSPDEGGLTADDVTQLTRGSLLKRAGLGLLGASAIPGLVEAGLPSIASARTLARLQKIAVIEQQFGTFFNDNFNKPAKQYVGIHPPWSVTFGNENNTVTTGINLLNQYNAQNYGVLILSTGDNMSAWEKSVGQVVKSGAIFINHCTQAVTGATQNVLFSHKQSGIDVGNASVKWAKRNHVANPVVGLIGNLSDAQGKKRTDWAWNTVKAKMPNAKLAGQVQGIGTTDGGQAAANLLSAHPDINMLITFNTLAGLAARTSAQHAGKTDRNTFLLATADSEDASLKLIAANNDIYQINWGAFFPASMILMLRDAAVAFKGGRIMPTRLIFGETIDTPAAAKSFTTITFNPLEPSYNYVFKKYFKYENVPVKTAQVPPGQ